jgi:hypothetical protein
METPSSFPQSIDIRPARSLEVTTWLPLVHETRGQNYILLVFQCVTARYEGVFFNWKTMGTWAQFCIDILPAKPELLAIPGGFADHLGRVGWGGAAFWRSPAISTSHLPIFCRGGNVSEIAGVDCAQTGAPRLSRDSAARCASCPLYVAPGARTHQRPFLSHGEAYCHE